MVKIGVPGRPYGLHAREDGMWVACYGDQSVVRIDPRHRPGRRAGPIRVGFNPVARRRQRPFGVGHERRATTA